MTEIRFIRRDAVVPRRERSEGETPAAPSPENLNPLIRSVAGASLEEIELIFLELQRIRDVLHGEGGRLSREVARYANLNQSVLATMKVIHESLKPIASADGTCASVMHD
jgi:hypothetical protein